jgi:signal transduction histidine kinase
VRWLLRKLGHGLPPLPTIGGHALATRVAGLLLVGGALLIVLTVVLPPSAEGSDPLILGYGAVAGLAGVLMLSRRRVSEPALGLAAALGTAVITLATLEAGQGVGAEDNEVLFLWVSLFAFWFFDLRHALLQLGLIGLGDAILLIDDGPSLSAGITRWVVTIATLLVTGILMSWLRRSLDREREETARLAVIAERMRIARDLHDAAGHGVTAISLQATIGLRAIDDGAGIDETRGFARGDQAHLARRARGHAQAARASSPERHRGPRARTCERLPPGPAGRRVPGGRPFGNGRPNRR